MFVLDLVTVNTAFYKTPVWWVLVGMLLVHVYYQFVGFHIARISEIPRGRFGRQYEDALWFRMLLGIAMLFTCGWLAVACAFVIMTLSIPVLFVPTRLHAYGILLERLGRGFDDVEKWLQPYLREHLQRRMSPGSVQ
jgi:hypothetical protein